MIRKVISYGLWVMGLITLLIYNSSLITHHYCFAQEDNKLVALSKQIIEAKTNDELYAFFAELKDLYFHENKYSEFVEFLTSLTQQKPDLEPFVNYYIGLSRYSQLKYLEETQGWDEYFNQGNAYRDQLLQSLQKTAESTNTRESLHLYSRLILWQFHKDQEDAFSEPALSDLMNAALEYSTDAQDIKPLKDAADKLLAYGQKAKSKELYQLYVNKLISTVKEDQELANIALGFYNEANLDLSETVYDVYMERAALYLKEESLSILKDIAQKFSYRDEGQKDAHYAEKIFAKIEEIGTKDAFDEGLLYLRAFNLEKIKDYSRAKDFYLDLMQRYPQSIRADEANFKIGVIFTYVLRDVKTGRDYFAKLAEKEIASPQVISSLYQLGLLTQWEGDSASAKEYYNKLIEKAKDGFGDSQEAARERLKEIEESRPIEYNLKTFLDVSLKEEYRIFEMTKLDLKASLYTPQKGQEINFAGHSYVGASGCMAVEIQYLWSGDLGAVKPSLQEPNFNTAYAQAGTKVLNLVAISPSGIVDRNIEIIDVY